LCHYTKRMNYFLSSFLFLLFFSGIAQEEPRFQEEVKAIQKKYDTLLDTAKETIVFTGSSSVRMWHDLQNRFPEYQIVNSGFGGSQTSDLMYYIYDLILRYEPKKVFIYEGDNDISAEKKPRDIIDTTERIIYGIRKNYPDTEIILISAKPSLARWNLRRKYRRLNRKFARLAQKDTLLEFADVWKPMLDGRKLKQDIFIKDGLHMNTKGYEIWFNVMRAHLK